MLIRDLFSHLFRSSVLDRSRRGRRLALEFLEERTTPTAAINTLASSYDVPAGATQLVPLSLVTPPNQGATVTYTAQSSNSQVTTQILTSTETLDLNVSGTDSTGTPFTGDLKIMLFPNESPLAVGRIVTLTDSGFYNGLTFHRIVNGFVIQGGDPNGNGTGGSTLGTFSDEFSTNLTFNSPGLIAFANSGSDTNNSQFFIGDPGSLTQQEQTQLQNLNFKYDIFGQLVSGFDTYEKIITTPVTENSSGEKSQPISKVTINSAVIIDDPTTAVVQITPASGFQGSTTIGVTANDGSGPSSISFPVNYVPPTVIDPPFLNPVANQTTEANTAITFPLSATDVESNASLTFVGADPSNFNNPPPNVTLSYNQSTGLVTVLPNSGFTGSTSIMFGVRDQNARDNMPLTAQSQYDTQVITLTVLPTSSGTGQTATTDSAFADPLVVTADNASGNPIANATVTFNAPSSGASVNFDSSSTVVTNAEGQASVAVTANDTPGAYFVTAVVNNTAYSFSLINAPNANQPPIVDTISAQSVNDGATLSFTIAGTAPTGNSISFSLGTGAPAGASINPQTGAFTWTPSENNSQGPGVYNIPVTVTENSAPNLSGSSTFAVTVGPTSTNQGTGLTSRTAVAAGIDNSQEYYTDLLDADYLKYVNRLPTTGELTSFWYPNLPIPGQASDGADFTDQVIEGYFIGSPEYIADHGGSDSAWIAGMYVSILGRTAATNEIQYWEGRKQTDLANGMTTGQANIDVAQGIVASNESESILVGADYTKYLGRSGAATEIAYWVNFFASGGTNEQVVAGFVASQEFFQDHGNNIVDWLYADYQATLNRLPDATGYNFWIAQLQ